MDAAAPPGSQFGKLKSGKRIGYVDLLDCIEYCSFLFALVALEATDNVGAGMRQLRLAGSPLVAYLQTLFEPEPCRRAYILS